MITKLTFLHIVMLIHVVCFSQLPKWPYEKMKFSNFSPEWYETTFDSTMISTECDGYNGFDRFENVPTPVIRENALYSIINITEDGYTWGYLLEKRTIDSGVLMWQKRFSKSNLTRQEMPRTLLVSEDKVIVISQQKVNPPKNSDPFFIFDLNTRMVVRKFDIETGLLIESLEPTPNDPSLVKMPSVYKKSDLYSNIFYTNKIDEYLYTERLQTNKVDKIVKMRINQRGQAISKRDTIILGNSANTSAHNLEQYNKDSLIYLNVKSSGMELWFYDMELKLLKKIAMEVKSPKIDYAEIIYLYQDYFIVKNSYIISLNPSNYGHEYLVYNYAGKLLQKMILRNFPSFDDNVCYVASHNKMFLFTDQWNEDTTNYQIQVYDAISQNEYHTLTAWDVDLPKKGAPEFIYPLPNNRLLIQLKEDALYMKNEDEPWLYDTYGYAYSQLMINVNLLIPLTSTEEKSLKNDSFKVYPNPAHEELNIVGNRNASFPIEIYSQLGQKLISEHFSTDHVKISSLKAGFYVIKQGQLHTTFVKY